MITLNLSAKIAHRLIDPLAFAHIIIFRAIFFSLLFYLIVHDTDVVYFNQGLKHNWTN